MPIECYFNEQFETDLRWIINNFPIVMFSDLKSSHTMILSQNILTYLCSHRKRGFTRIWFCLNYVNWKLVCVNKMFSLKPMLKIYVTISLYGKTAYYTKVCSFSLYCEKSSVLLLFCISFSFYKKVIMGYIMLRFVDYL